MLKLDEKDWKILEALKENAKLTSQKISKKTQIPITTVHNRIKKMERKGIIKKYVPILNYKKIGKPISAYLLIDISFHSEDNVIEEENLCNKIKAHPAVDEISIVTGRTDILVRIRVKDMNELRSFSLKFLRKIEGVKNTHTLVVLKEVDL